MDIGAKTTVQAAVLFYVISSNLLCPVGAYLYNNRYAGDQVIRVTPQNSAEVQTLKSLFENMRVDLWQPNSASFIGEGSTVDIHTGRNISSAFKTYLRRANLHYEVLIANLQKEIEKQTGYRSSRKRRSEMGYDYEAYHSLEEIQSWMHEMNRTHPHFVTLFSIGRSFEGRPLYVLQLGKRTRRDKKAVWIDCGVHAREWISPAFCQWFVKEVGALILSCCLNTGACHC
uniref:Carboxypeptidase A6 n=1 Tax=Lepisosteus oculatus TaxID=7918 RepID=W5MA16_LEPOC